MLYIGNNDIGESGAIELAKSLYNKKKLKSLCVTNNFIKNKGARELSKSLLNKMMLNSLCNDFDKILTIITLVMREHLIS